MTTKRLSNLPIRELQTEIRRRERRLEALHRRRDKLAGQLCDIEAELLEAGGAIGAIVGRKRPRNERSLADALAALLATKALSVTEAAEQVQSAGYRTTSPNFRTIVNQTLIKDPRFKRVERGRYAAKGGVGAKKSSRRGTR